MTRLNGQVPLIGQGMTREQAMQMELLQQINNLSLTIYARLACEQISAAEHSHVDIEKLKAKAKNSRVAAQAYFEGLGVIEPKK